MTKEELEKEAEEWIGRNKPVQDDWEDSDIIQAIVDTNEKREKRIKELEAQIEQNKIDLAISEHDREHDDYELTEAYKKIEQLEKENAELKEQISTKDILIKELQEQKVYWKESSFDWRHKFFKLDKDKQRK